MYIEYVCLYSMYIDIQVHIFNINTIECTPYIVSDIHISDNALYMPRTLLYNSVNCINFNILTELQSVYYKYLRKYNHLINR